MGTRDHIVLYLNGQRREVRGGDCFLSLSDFLRNRQGLVGTKIVCSEGDCGSCTVLVGQLDGDEIRYRPIDSCIRFMFQLDGTHVITIEGLQANGNLTPIQQSMVDCHGSQCGFCTPGFVMAMTGLCEDSNSNTLTENDWRQGLTGNLCRCTGYTSIIKAGMNAAQCQSNVVGKQAFSQSEKSTLIKLCRDTLDLRGQCNSVEQRAYCPVALDKAVKFRQDHPTAKVIAGATDVGVQLNKRVIEPTVFLDLNRISELEGVQVKPDGEPKTMVAGARATWTELLEAYKVEVPEFAQILSVFGSPQIRHVGTIGGNIINASPISDSIPFLMVMETELELVGSSGRRQVSINNFYQGYKRFDLRSDELLASVRIPLPSSDDLLRLYKVSRRRDLDIATFTAAIRLRLDGDTITDAALAYGAVGPTVIRLRQTEQFLQGKPFREETMQAAGDVAIEEITPISDVRGSADYRYQLARNVLLKFWQEQQLVTT